MKATVVCALSLVLFSCGEGGGSAPDVDVADIAGVDAPAEADTVADAGGACEPIPRVAVASARLTVDEACGGLRDAMGRDVVMRGLNCGGRAKWAPFMPFLIEGGDDLETVRAKATTFFARMVGWGLDTVRLTFSWEALEPEEGVIDEVYLDRYEAMVDAAWALRLRVIVDFHQDIFASPLCGDGFPAWTLPDAVAQRPPRHDCPAWGFAYALDADVRTAFDRFWANEDGIQDAFEAMWDLMATRFRDHPGVVGFEIINEPGWGTASSIDDWKDEVLTGFHTKMVKRLQAIAPTALVFYDNTGADAITGMDATYPRPEGDGLVFGPHYYDQGIFTGAGWSGDPPEPVIQRMADFMATRQAHVLLGEFGIHGETDEGAEEWLSRVMDAVDQHRISATLWEYSINDEPWNGEDLSVFGPDGQERPNLDVYVRPWLEAVAGTGSSFSWDVAAGKAEASWIAAEGVSEIAVPPRLFPDGPVDLTVQGDGACASWDPDRGEIRVRAPAGTTVAVTFGR